MSDTRKVGKLYPHCPKCGQPIRSSERLVNHLVRCEATGQWRKKRRRAGRCPSAFVCLIEVNNYVTRRCE